MTLWVIKIGTNLLRGDKSNGTFEIINRYSSSIAECRNRGDKVVIVTSGAVGLGCDQLKINDRPENVVSVQATAAIVQGHLMALYKEALGKYGFIFDQVFSQGKKKLSCDFKLI